MSGLAKEKVLKLAKGFLGRGKNCIRIARNRVDKALQYALIIIIIIIIIFFFLLVLFAVLFLCLGSVDFFV